MSRWLGWASLLCLSWGCRTTPSDQLQGVWRGHAVENFPEGQQHRVLGWVKGATFKFEGRRVTVASPTEPPRQGTFEVASADGDRLSLRFLRPHGGRDNVDFEFIDDENLRWTLGDGRSIVLRKVEN